jgi:hypothetical protein
MNLFAAKFDCSPNIEEAPPCPKNSGMLLDDRYPVAMASVSTQQGISFAYDFVTKVMFAQSKPIPIVVSSNQIDFELLLNKIEKSDLSNEQKRQSLKLLKRIEPSNGEGENWQQDFYEAQFNPKTGYPVLKPVGNYLQYRKMRTNYIDAIIGTLKPCGLSKGTEMKVESDPKYYTNGMSGGNIESLPNGICLIGRDNFVDNDHFHDYARSACGSVNYIETPSDFLEVGHTDEFMNVIRDPSKKPPCNFAITMASPRKAIELLKANPQAKLFTPTLMNSRSYQTVTEICQAIKKKSLTDETFRKSNPQNPANRNSRGQVKLFLNYYLFENAFAKAGADKNTEIKISPEENAKKELEDQYYKNSRKLYKDINKDPIRECSQMTNSDLLNYIEQDGFDTNSNQMQSDARLANESIQKKLDDFKLRLLDKLRVSNSACQPEIIDVPFLFNAKYDSGSKSAQHALSYFPNSTNGLSIGNKYIFPSLGNEVFEKYTVDQYKEKGIEVDSIDTFWAHENQGNLHCSSHLIRYCNPRSTP